MAKVPKRRACGRNFSKVSFIFIVHSKFSMELTFEKFSCQTSRGVARAAVEICPKSVCFTVILHGKFSIELMFTRNFSWADLGSCALVLAYKFLEKVSSLLNLVVGWIFREIRTWANLFGTQVCYFCARARLYYKCVISRMNASCHVCMRHVTYECAMSRMNAPCPVSMNHSYVTWLIHTWHDTFIRDMTHSYVTWCTRTWHDAFIRDMTHSYVTWLIHTWHDAFIRDMSHSYVTWVHYCKRAGALK